METLGLGLSLLVCEKIILGFGLSVLVSGIRMFWFRGWIFTQINIQGEFGF